MGVQGEWSWTHEDHTSTHLYTTTRSVERVSNFTHLGIHVASKINWSLNSCVYQGPEERTSFLGCLSSVGASEAVLCLYCRANTESVIRYRTAVWYGNFPEQANARLRRFVSTNPSVLGNRTSPLHNKYSIPQQLETRFKSHH